MGRWGRDRLFFGVGLTLVICVGLRVVWAFRLPPADRGDALTLLGLVVAVVAALTGVAALRRRHVET